MHATYFQCYWIHIALFITKSHWQLAHYKLTNLLSKHLLQCILNGGRIAYIVHTGNILGRKRSGVSRKNCKFYFLTFFKSNNCMHNVF